MTNRTKLYSIAVEDNEIRILKRKDILEEIVLKLDTLMEYNDYLERVINDRYCKLIEAIRDPKNIYDPIMDDE